MNRFYGKLIQQWRQQMMPTKSTAGFTVLEIIVTSLMGAILVAGLTDIMVDLLRSNAIEQATYQTKKDMKRALAYITAEIQQAVYVYDGQELAARTNLNLPGVEASLENNASGVKTILAFWKIEGFNSTDAAALNGLNCDSFNGDTEQECINLQISRHTYNLVVYVQSTASSSTWSGASRIERYEIPKYSSVSSLTRSSGYVDPTSESSFARWPYSNDPNDSFNNLQNGQPNETNRVLVDYVDDPANIPADGIPDCTEAGYTRTPLANTTPPANSFFACVRNATAILDANLTNVNQDTFLYLRGNLNDRLSFDTPYAANDIRYLPFATARVGSRSVYDKQITQ